MSLDRKPPWLRVKAPGGERYVHIKEALRKHALHSVCEEALCPNVGECWAMGTATLMILGDVCTRGCRFCAVAKGNPGGALDPMEPEHVGQTIASMALRYVVITMVDRDDIADGGAAHVSQTLKAIRRASPEVIIEALVGDFQGRLGDVASVVRDGEPDVFSHNVETVARLQRSVRDVRCGFEQSLKVLAHAKETAPEMYSKSSIMLGLGETPGEVIDAMRALRAVDVDVLTLGQYLRPTPKHHEVVRYVTPDEFDELGAEGERMGFRLVAAGPLVRSSYKAAEGFINASLTPTSQRAKARRSLPVLG